MNLQEIKDAIDSGKTVCWASEAYEVQKYTWKNGEVAYNIICLSNDNCCGLTHKDGKTMNGEEKEFFIK